LTISRVTPGSAADQAGLRVGDRLVEFDGHLVTDGGQFRLIVLAANSPTRAVVNREGEAEPIELDVTLPGKPVRLGISWDVDRASPTMVILTRVVPGSAADLAGLATKDRVYAVSGQDFSGSDGFGQLVTAGDGPIDLLVERRGVLQTRTINPLSVRTDFGAATDAADPSLD
jgi:S1-C subfamily serine protease